METLEQLIESWLDDELSSDDSERLSALLNDDVTSIELLADHAEMHADLRRSLQRRNIQQAAVDAVNVTTINAPETTNRKRSSRWAVAATLAALMCVLLILSWPGSQTEKRTPAALATLSQQVNANWEKKPLRNGESVGPGILRLKSGFARLDFENGAFVTLQGPAVFEVINSNQSRLHSGMVTAHIPKSAVGFRIETPALDVTDLGTAFGVSVDEGGRTEVCVFEGEVAVKTPENDTQKIGVRVREGRSVTSRKGKSGIKHSEFQSDQFRESWSLTSGVLRTSGEMRFVSPGPTFVPGRYEDSQHILVFPERRDVQLTQAIPIDLSTPGQYRRIPRLQIVELPAGQRVQSFLIQFDPIGRLARRTPGKSRVRGEIVFDRPIVALIANGRKLTATDSLLGHPNADYGKLPRGLEPVRPLIPGEEGRDRVVLANDRRTLTLDLAAGSALDQIRVLVLSPSDAGTIK